MQKRTKHGLGAKKKQTQMWFSSIIEQQPPPTIHKAYSIFCSYLKRMERYLVRHGPPFFVLPTKLAKNSGFFTQSTTTLVVVVEHTTMLNKGPIPFFSGTLIPRLHTTIVANSYTSPSDKISGQL